MDKIQNLLLLLFIFVLTVCNTDQQNKIPEKIFWLEGRWQLEESGTYEIWKKDKHELTGRLIKIEKKDTVVLERLKLKSIENSVFYEATVSSQNYGKPVCFRLTKSDDKEFIFENPEHDFPKKITYVFNTQNQLTARISGNNKAVEFKYKRIE
jgi:hypothetical protein